MLKIVKKLTKKKVRRALPGSHGIIQIIATKCQVDRGTIYRYMEKHPDIAQDIMDEREKIIDVAEGKLFTKIHNGDFKALRYFLDRKGKKRGYTTKQEVELKGAMATSNKLSKKQIEELLEDLKSNEG